MELEFHAPSAAHKLLVLPTQYRNLGNFYVKIFM